MEQPNVTARSRSHSATPELKDPFASSRTITLNKLYNLQLTLGFNEVWRSMHWTIISHKSDVPIISIMIIWILNEVILGLLNAYTSRKQNWNSNRTKHHYVGFIHRKPLVNIRHKHPSLQCSIIEESMAVLGIIAR